MTARHHRSPTVDEIADATDLDVDVVLEALDAGNARVAASLDQSTSSTEQGERRPLIDGLGSTDHRLELTDIRESVAAILREVPERERQILELRLFAELSQADIAERVGLSQMHVSRLIRRTLDQLRSSLD